MSEKTKNKSKPHRSATEKLGFDWVTSSPEPTNPKSIFFPEWVDDEINLTSLSFLSHGGKHKERPEKTEKSEKAEKLEEHSKAFEDPQVLFLPFCLQDLQHDWKRPYDIFPEYQFVIFTEENEYSILLDASAHLVNSTFVRSFISSIHILEYLAQSTNFAQESTTSKYVPNATGPWKPWHHVYGCSKVGAGTVHNPQVNSAGKYIVRLFWLGAWRKVVIDDFLPVDIAGHVLLPSLRIPPRNIQSNNVRLSTQEVKEKDRQQKLSKPEKPAVQPTVILWPFLLSKALLKLANMTMQKDKDLLHFNIVHCLTGWVLQRLDLKGVPSEHMWEICRTYTKLYSWQDFEITKQASEMGNRKKDKKNKNAEKNLLKVLKPTPEASKTSHYFMALCRDMRNLKQSTVSGMSPCWGHEILIDECRDIPLEKPPPNPEYPSWKKFRWMEWAKSKGLITEPKVMDTTRYLRCLSPFAKCAKFVINREISPKESKIQFPLRKSIALMQKQLPNFNKNDKTDQGDEIFSRIDSHREKLKEKKPALEPSTDPCMWISFEDLCCQLISFNVFYKSSTFSHRARVSDMEMNEISDNNPKNKSASKMNLRKNDCSWNDVIWPNFLEERGNMPLYFFIDSMDTKMVLVNLAQAGDSERLVPLDDEFSEHNFFLEYDRLFGERVKMSQEDSVHPPKILKLNRSRIHAGLKCSHVMFEKYRWDTVETGKVKFFLNTYGNSSALLELKPGRHVYRLWINSHFSYCITILADTRFNVGSFEQILDEMAEEPMRMTQFTLDISDCFGRLVGSFGTTEFAYFLRRFYHSYLPRDADKNLSKCQRYLVHEMFQKSLLRFLQYSQDYLSLQKMMDSLRTVFLDRNIRIQKHTYIPTQDFRKEQFQFQSLQEKIICERAGTTLTAFFKMLQMKMLYERHRPTNKFFQETCETLRCLYVDNFSLDQRDECLGSIVRNFFKDENMTDFLIFYDIHKDFKWDVTVQTFTGSSELTRDYVILCSIKNYALRIIDNDTEDEIYRFTNQVFPNTFKPNIFGYTVIGFAWFKEVKLINWKLAVISERATTTKFEMEEIKTATTAALDHYLPICKALIGRHSIFVRENVIFTFRFSCSYRNVKFNVKLFDPAKNLIVDKIGMERLIIPSVLLRYVATSEVITHVLKPRSSRSSGKSTKLDHRKSTDRTSGRKESRSALRREDLPSTSDFEPQVYNLEFHVVDNSWPLTKAEWEVVRKLREDTYYFNPNGNKDSALHHELSSKSVLKSAKDVRKGMLRKVQSIEKPWYLLQYSFKTNAQVALIKDKSEEEKVFSLKKFWYQKDPDRYARSFDLRQNYLKQYTDPGCQCPEEFINSTPVESQSRTTDISIETNTNSGPPKEEDDENAERTTKGPRWTEANVPPFDLSPYYRPQCPCPMDFRRKIVKTEQDHATDREERLRIIEEYNDSIMKNREDMELWINESNERKTLVFLWYADIRKASERILQENQVMRQNFFDKWAKELLPPPKSEKKKTGGADI